MPEPARTAATLVASLFGLAAFWILTAQAFGRLRGRRIWTTFFVEILTLSAVLLPAFFGWPWLQTAILAIGFLCAREAAIALGRAGAPPLARTGVVLYPGLFAASLIALGSTPTGFGDVFFCYALVELNDSLGYLIGATFGRIRVAPKVSPNKTLEGLLGGLVLTIAMSPLFHFALPGLSLGEIVGGAALLAGCGVAGDLLASRLKRAAAIKDFGSLVPTHGGVLDVYDSLLFASPFFHAYLSICRSR